MTLNARWKRFQHSIDISARQKALSAFSPRKTERKAETFFSPVRSRCGIIAVYYYENVCRMFSRCVEQIQMYPRLFKRKPIDAIHWKAENFERKGRFLCHEIFVGSNTYGRSREMRKKFKENYRHCKNTFELFNEHMLSLGLLYV